MPSRVRRQAVAIVEQGPEAVAGLFDLTSHRLVRLSTTITRNQHDGEDAVQVCLTAVAACPDRLVDAANPWAYLLQMVRNESLKILRARKRITMVASLADLLIVRRVDEVERAETHHAIWLALRKLPTQQSEVIVLKIWESMTFAEIAACLELSPSTVASQYRYGMRKLDVLLRDETGRPIAEVLS